MAGYSVPLGVRFRPNKLELVEYFLAMRLSGQELPSCYPQFIDFDVYTDHPFNILASTKERRGATDVNEGFFFCRLNKVTPNGTRIVRHIEGHGTWSEKSGITEVRNGKSGVGIEKYLKFKPNKKSNNNNNNNEDEWKMHEYSRNGNEEMVLCHITKKPVSTKKRMIMPIQYQVVSSSKRGRIEYEQPSSGCNNSGIIINPNQDYMSRAVDEAYQVEYCGVPQGHINSAVVEPSNEALAMEIQGMIDVDEKDNIDNADNNQAYYEVEDGILELTELGDQQVYDMEPLLEQAAEHGSLSGCNNSGIINPNQDYVSQAVISSYQDEYCLVPQGNNDSALVEPSSEASTKHIEGMMLDCDDMDENKAENNSALEDASNKAYVEDVEGMNNNNNNNNNKAYDMELLQEQAAEHGPSLANGAQEGDAKSCHIENIDQFLQDFVQTYWLPKGDSLSTNEFGFDDLEFGSSLLYT